MKVATTPVLLDFDGVPYLGKVIPQVLYLKMSASGKRWMKNYQEALDRIGLSFGETGNNPMGGIPSWLDEG